MKSFIFANRNFKEMARDPISIFMGIGFPVMLIVALSLMKQSIGEMADIFEVQNFAPSMTIFGLAFLGMFVGTLMSTDRDRSFLARLFASPLRGIDYILGYSLPVIPLAILQAVCCFLVAMLFGLKLNTGVFVAIATLLPIAVMFISFGLFMGCVFTSTNSVNGFGTILVNAAVFLSGAVLPIEAIGGAFEAVCNFLPFANAVNAVRSAISGSYADIFPHLAWVLGYAVVLFIPSVLIFNKKMKG